MRILFLILCLWWSVAAQAHTQPLREQLYGAYIQNDKPQLLQLVQQLESTPYTFTLAEAQCLLLTYALGHKDEALFEQFVEKAQQNLEVILKKDPQHAQAHALLAQVYGFRIAYSPWRGIFLGSRSNRHIGLSIAANPNEPLGWYQRGNARFNAPAAFGGDKEQAVKDFEKAVWLMEQSRDLTHNWYYLDMLAWLGIAYRDTGQPQKAVQTWQKALALEPRRDWIRNELLAQNP
ncbi:MAG: tetratricopeptide repeat protein [Bernardetiaceae bacterium]